MQRWIIWAAAAAAAAAGAMASAQSYPVKPVRIVIPFVPGGPSDTVGRAVGSQVQAYLGQPAIVENRQGEASFQNMGNVATQIRAGKIRALAVTANSRAAALPDVPTMAEAGYPGLIVTSWQAAAAPAKTPREVVARLNDTMVKALRSPDVRDRLTAIGFDVVASTPEQFGQFMKNEVERWTQVVQRGGIKPD